MCVINLVSSRRTQLDSSTTDPRVESHRDHCLSTEAASNPTELLVLTMFIIASKSVPAQPASNRTIQVANSGIRFDGGLSCLTGKYPVTRRSIADIDIPADVTRI